VNRAPRRAHPAVRLTFPGRRALASTANLEHLHQSPEHLKVEGLVGGDWDLDGTEQIPVRPEVGPEPRGEREGVRAAAVDRLGQVAGQIEDEIAERRGGVRSEVVADGEIGDEGCTSADLVDTLVPVRHQESGAPTDHEALPPVGPELIRRRDGGHAVHVVGAPGRGPEGHVERLREVPRLGEEEAAHDLQVSEIRLVVAPEGPPVRDRHRDVETKLEALIQGQIELEETRLLVAVLQEIVGVAVGRDAEAVEYAVEGVEPPLPRRPSRAVWRADLVPVSAIWPWR